MCFLLSAREVLDDVPTSSAHAIHDFHGFPELNGYRSLTRLSPGAWDSGPRETSQVADNYDTIYIDTMMTPSWLLDSNYCVNITVLTGIDVDLDSDCHNHYLGSQLLCLSLQKSPPISWTQGSKVTVHAQSSRYITKIGPVSNPFPFYYL